MGGAGGIVSSGVARAPLPPVEPPLNHVLQATGVAYLSAANDTDQESSLYAAPWCNLLQK